MQECSSFDTRTTMGELNTLIEVIDEKWEQIGFNIQYKVQSERLPRKTALEYQRAAHSIPPVFGSSIWSSMLMFALILLFSSSLMSNIFLTVIMLLSAVGIFILFFQYGIHPLYYDKNSVELDSLIKKEWYPRMKILRENVHLFTSDKDLRHCK